MRNLFRAKDRPFWHNRRLLSEKRVEIKVCGITRAEDALLAADLGVSAIGLNFWTGTPRYVGQAADAIFDALERRGLLGHLELVGVFVDPSREALEAWSKRFPLDALQLHGNESPEWTTEMAKRLPVYKAFGIGKESTATTLMERVSLFPGKRILLDARVPGAMPGGTGHVFDWTIAQALSEAYEVTLAGGLGPHNIREAITTAKPYRVDVASGVETRPGVKDAALLRAFVQEVRSVSL